MNTAICIAVTLLLAALCYCSWRLVKIRHETLRLSEAIQAFLTGETQAPAFSVMDNSFALFENEVVELMARLVQSRENASSERAKNQTFLLDVSHQLKTPIAGLRLMTELDDSPHRDQQLQLIGRMETLLQSLLKLEKLRADGYAMDFQMTSLGSLALEARAELAALFPQKRIEVEGDARIRCDAHWIAEALINLLKNACEHTCDSGHIALTIHQDDSEAIVCVEDDGGGVPEHALPKLFERFYRATPEEPGKHQGVGLGLSIVKTIAAKHHGSIRAENGAHGLVITIYLPVLHGHLKKT